MGDSTLSFLAKIAAESAPEQLALGPIFVQENQEEPAAEITLRPEEKRFVPSSGESPSGGTESKAKRNTANGEARELAPMLRHYLEVKKRYPEHVLLYQVGDFYELFFDDARAASEALSIRLTSRDKDAADPIPMCGVPIHALENYLPRLLKHGFSCVIMSQAEDAKSAKGMVRREITRIVTPGVRYEGDGLDEKEFNYLAALCFSTSEAASLVYTDVSVGRLQAVEPESADELIECLKRLKPTEIIFPSTFYSKPQSHLPALDAAKKAARELGAKVTYRPFSQIAREQALQRLLQLVASKDEGKLQASLTKLTPPGLSSLAVLLDYVEEVSFGSMPVFSLLEVDDAASSVFIDTATRRNLELTETRIDGDRKNSLLGNIDYCRTAMGSRLLAAWVLSPSADLGEIERRLNAVEELVHNQELLYQARACLPPIRDLDRLLSRISSGRANPRDLGMLLDSTRVLPEVQRFLQRLTAPLFVEIAESFDPLTDVSDRLERSLAEDPPLRLNEGGIFRDGFHAEVDKLRKLRKEGHLWLAELETKERQRTGITGLKVRYNNVFGYFIEVTKSHLQKVPAEYERRQTLANAERFITRELKEFESAILSAKNRQFDLERELFFELRSWTALQAARIQRVSQLLSVVDVLCSYAHLALLGNYCRPVLHQDAATAIYGGRHPVVERVLGTHNFIANDTRLDTADRRFAVLTGPNMGGKSTYLRQIGLIQLLAQAGSFVPAGRAELGLVDRIFTRIGAADDLARGDSTFMVEMREAAVIVRKATSRSLVLIDEIGRGTATTDGLALATAISEWLIERTGCRTVFATHFHELTKLPDYKQGAFCLAVGVNEQDEDIIFTHRIEEKAADRSYGIEVARLAGLPEALLARAKTVLAGLEADGERREALPDKAAETSGISPLENRCWREVRERLLQRDFMETTPLQALHELIELKAITERETS